MIELLNYLRRPRVIALVVAAGIGFGFLIEWIIVTDRERVDRILDDARAFALEGRWDEAVDLLDPDFAFEGMSREKFRGTIRETLKDMPLKQFNYFRRAVEIREGGMAVADVTIILRAPEGLGTAVWDERMGGNFEITFRKREDTGWAISAIKMIR